MADPLFTKSDLESWLSYETGAIADAQHDVVERMVRGMILSATEWTDFPAPLPEQVWAWALELGGILFENPTDQQYDSTNLVQSSWRDRKSQILAELKLWAKSTGTTGSAVPLSRGSFPAPRSYPDPAYRYGMRP